MSKNLFKNKSLDTLPLDFHVENHPLDGEQRKSIYDPARFNLVVAGAGSGKTTTILGKILYLLQSGFASPPEILVLSFTHDSATELRGRFLREYYQTFAKQILLRKSPPPTITIETFHSLALKLLRSLWSDFSVTTNEVDNEQPVSKITDNVISGSDELTIQTSIIREFLDLHELAPETVVTFLQKNTVNHFLRFPKNIKGNYQDS